MLSVNQTDESKYLVLYIKKIFRYINESYNYSDIDEPDYIIKLIGKIVMVSVETVRIVKGMW